MSNIQYLQRKEVNTDKWDKCIAEAENSLIYGYSWWLDNISASWDALILGDYDAVMPLTWRKKYGFYYLYQPFCTAALGFFFKKGIVVTTEDFFLAIPRKFSYWDIDINEKNGTAIYTEMNTARINYMLPLSDGYERIKQNYSRLAKRMMTRAVANELKIVANADAESIVELYRKEYHHQHKATQQDYTAISNCCKLADGKGLLRSYIAQLSSGEPVGFYLVLQDEHFAYSLLGGSTGKGKDTGAFYLLTDAAIKDQCAGEKTFRFEGSDKDGIALFNRQFGAEPIAYTHIRRNKLPFFIRAFKK